jgi:hypothetical protein
MSLLRLWLLRYVLRFVAWRQTGPMAARALRVAVWLSGPYANILLRVERVS